MSPETNGSPRPVIFLLSLEDRGYWDKMYGDLADKLAAKAVIE